MRGHRISGAQAAIYSFKRHDDGPGKRPAIAFVVEHVGPGYASVDQFAAAKRRGLPPYTVEQELPSGDIGLPGAVGVRAHSNVAGVAHSMFVVYALHDKIGIVILMDAPSARFGAVEPEFRAALRSLRYYR